MDNDIKCSCCNFCKSKDHFQKNDKFLKSCDECRQKQQISREKTKQKHV